MVTKLAMMMMKHGIRTAFGMTRRNPAIIAFEQTRTTVAASAIEKAFFTLVVVASVGQIPRISPNVGLFLKMPLVNSSRCRGKVVSVAIGRPSD